MTIVADAPNISVQEKVKAKLIASCVIANAALADHTRHLDEAVAEIPSDVLTIRKHHLHRDASIGSTFHLFEQIHEASSYVRYFTASPGDKAFEAWGHKPVGTGPHFADDDTDEPGNRYGHRNLGQFTLLCFKGDDAVLLRLSSSSTAANSDEEAEEEPHPHHEGFNVFKPSHVVTDATKVWAASVLSGLPTKIIFKTEIAVQEFTESSGKLFRRAFGIVADPHGVGEFRIYLHAGATQGDLHFAERQIRYAKAGLFNSDLWEHREASNSWLNGHYFQADPKEKWAYARELRECSDQDCAKPYHEYIDGEFNSAHRLDTGDESDEIFEVFAHNLEDGAGWNAWIDFGEDIPDGREGLEVMRRAASAYSDLQDRCDGLNRAGEAE